MNDEEYAAARTAALSEILQSNDRLKLIVAGPGTGKTFTFQKLLEQTDSASLAMTFLLVLVRDLETKFDETVDVYSFHGFARRLLPRIDIAGITRSVHYYPPVVLLEIEDLRILDGIVVDQLKLGSLFRNLADMEPILQRAISSGNYYNAVSHDDGVYRVLRELESNAGLVPVYGQIVVDEFQDFCPLDVAFIRVLATKSPTLIVGDDDQALYAFRDASPDAIRELANGNEYRKFDLPYCTRCTEVLVSATHTVVERAQTVGLLEGRLPKEYVCYLPDKRAESEKYGSIVHAHCSVQTNKCPYMGMYVEAAIRVIPADEILESHTEGFPTVLIIGPRPFLPQIESHLRTVFSQVTGPTASEINLDALEAYNFLSSDEASNIGWRILLQLLQPDDWEDAVRGGLGSGDDLRAQLDQAFIDHHLATARILRRLRAGESVSTDESAALAHALGVDPDELEARLAGSETSAEVEVDTALPTIMLTSLMGSKGLQAAHVFIVGMNDKHFPQSNAAPTNAEVCQLLVALTRARKSCTLVSTGRLGNSEKSKSVFLEWLRPHLSAQAYVNKAFFQGLEVAADG